MIHAEYYLSQAFVAFFRQRVAESKDLALITVLSTDGSTYSKAGMQMLVDEDGSAQGMLSGGCLEGDLAERVMRALKEGKPASVTYDLNNDDGLFGLNVGCEGAIRALILPLCHQDGYEPLAAWLESLDKQDCVDIDLSAYDADGSGPGMTRVYRPRSLLVLGAGKDAEPLISLAQTLGWHVTVFDHRAAYLENPAIQVAEAVYCDEPRRVAQAVDLKRVDAAIIMSHNLTADVEYLGALADSVVDFVGLIGPPHRRDRLLSELGGRAASLDERLRAPVGTIIGGRGPAAIALEIVAELQAYFSAARS
ncbi:MAG: XdhC family protein [Woeseiaceae bacterium]|jgi:xanthine dehydrogenase accessory factor